MNAILGWLSILESGKPIREICIRRSPSSQRNAQMQAKLIDDLLDMNRLTVGQRAAGDRAGRHRRAAAGDDAGPAAGGRREGRPAHRVASSRTSARCCADSRRLQQVLWNLVHNAIKFTPAGGRVDIHVQRVDQALQFDVEDNGQGISRAFLPHVFERFRQQDASSTRAAPGLGLGLSIAKQLVELHGGTITAPSAGEGKGATFTVRVPAPPRKVLSGLHALSSSLA